MFDIFKTIVFVIVVDENLVLKDGSDIIIGCSFGFKRNSLQAKQKIFHKLQFISRYMRYL